MRIITILAYIVFSLSASCAADQWNIEVVDNSGAVGWYTAIVIDTLDNIHISYSNDDADYSDLNYNYYDGTTWNKDIVDAGGATGYFTSIDVDSNNYPHISYTNYEDDGDNDYLHYARWDGTTWHIEKLVSSYLCYGDTEIRLDSSDNPHIIYFDSDDDDLEYIYKDGSGWISETIDSAVEGLYEGNSMELDSNGKPCVAYIDAGNDTLKYAYYSGGTWHTEIVDDSSTIDIGSDPSLALDSSYNPHISYNERNYPESHLRYAYHNGSTWTIEIVDDRDETGSDSDIVLDSNDEPHISYGINHTPDWSLYDLIYATKSSGVWQIETIDDGAGDTYEMAGSHTSIALNSDEKPHVIHNAGMSYPEGVKHVWFGEPPTAIDDDNPVVVTEYLLRNAYPNPSNGDATIKFALPETANVNLSVYDIKGRKVSTLINELLDDGEHTADISGLANGIYLYKLTANEFSNTKKLVIK